METTALWQQILAAPHDENLKTQYIEALRRAGGPRAEVFRLAEELQRFPVYYVQHDEIARRYESSLDVWRQELAPFAATWQAQIDFVAGWPVQITIAAPDFLHHAEEIVATIPVRHLHLTAISAAPEVFTVAPFHQIVSLQASHQPWTREGIQALAASPYLQTLRWLDLSHCNLTDAEVEILAASPQLREVVHLDLQHNPCRDPVDASCGYGVDGISGFIVSESIWLPEFGKELEARYGAIEWLHALRHFMEKHPPNRYQF